MAYFRCGNNSGSKKSVYIKVMCVSDYQGYDITCTTGSLSKTKKCNSDAVEFVFTENEVSELPATFTISNSLNSITTEVNPTMYGWYDTELNVWDGYLYKSGDTDYARTSITGGWKGGFKYTSSRTTISGTIDINQMKIIGGSNEIPADLATVNLIDFDNVKAMGYKYLKADCAEMGSAGYNGDSLKIVSDLNLYSEHTIATVIKTKNARETISLDLSSITGKNYVVLQASQSRQHYVYNVWFE